MPKKERSLQQAVIRLVRVHLLYMMVFVVAAVLFDAWNLITPETIIERWAIAGVMAVVTALVWYASRQTTKSQLYYSLLTFVFVALDIYVATYSVYSQRGIASRGVFLYAIPIIVSAVLLSRSAIFATATLSAAAYATVVVRYFYLNPGQAYKVELYGELAFYIAIMFVLAGLLWVVVSRKPEAHD